MVGEGSDRSIKDVRDSLRTRFGEQQKRIKKLFLRLDQHLRNRTGTRASGPDAGPASSAHGKAGCCHWPVILLPLHCLNENALLRGTGYRQGLLETSIQQTFGFDAWLQGLAALSMPAHIADPSPRRARGHTSGSVLSITGRQNTCNHTHLLQHLSS
jgi:hypothetical protein